MYRAVALAALREKIDLDCAIALTGLAGRLDVALPPGRILMNGEDITDLIRTPQVAQASSRVAVCPGVRAQLVDWQRYFAAENDTVSDGRDQGTVVFPEARRKFYLTASPESRAERRYAEMITRGLAPDPAEVLREQIERDARDADRSVGPMRPAPDALVVDTTGLDVHLVLDLVEQAVRDDGPLPWLPRESGETPRPPGYFAGYCVAWEPGGRRLVAVALNAEDANRAAQVEARAEAAREGFLKGSQEGS